jgi:UDP-glucose 4-epimerase
VPAFVDAALRNEPLLLNGDGLTSRDFTHVSTVAAVLTDAVTRRVTSPDPVNLAFGTRTTLRELIALIEELVGTPLEVKELPERAGDVRHSQADSTQLKVLFPDVSPIELREALADTIDWFKEAAAAP